MKREKESQSLHEVRKWKKEVARKTKKLHGAELLAYFNRIAQVRKNKKAA